MRTGHQDARASRREPRAGRRAAVLSTDEFVAELLTALDAARTRISIQLMTFDGDAAGHAVTDRLIRAAERGVTTRVLVDCFAHRVVSDRPISDPSVAGEYRAGLVMYERLAAAGVSLRFTNPNGPRSIYALARNHKKLFVIDDVVYLGGINVSDHNFSWHDLMIRVVDEDIRRAVIQDFDVTYSGRRQRVDRPIVTNEALEATFDRLVAGARERVIVVSPYSLDRALVDRLERSSAPSRTVVTLADNNFRFLRWITPYLAARLRAAGVHVAAYERFSHAKVLIADDRLLVGSSNFGRHSFWCDQEIGLVVDDPSLVEAVVDLLLGDPEARRVDLPPTGPGRWALGWLLSALMDGFLRAYRRFVVPRVPLLDPDPPTAP